MADNNGALRLLLVDDHALFREGLFRLLEREPGFAVVGRTGRVAEALQVLKNERVDIVLLDYDLGSERALDLLAEARRLPFAGKVLIVTAGVSEQEAIHLIESGVAGIFHKHNPPESIRECLREVANGEVWLERGYLKPLFGQLDATRTTQPATLTDKERKVLRGVFQGLGNKEIGATLGVSESSVKGILQQLFHKTGVRTRSQLVRVALELFREQLDVQA
jgi:two-component system nitrate/nitrite response regulator NarL